MSQQHRDGATVRASNRRERRRERGRRLARATASVVGRLLRRSAATLARSWAAARLDGLAALRFEQLETRQMLDATPLTFAPVDPLGVQVYAARATGNLASAAQSDVYQVTLNTAGKLSFAATTTDGSLRLHVVVANDDSSATIITSVDGGANGKAASAQNLQLAAGTYDVTVTADAAPGGDGAYALKALVNASVQAGAATNTTIGAGGTATSLAGSALNLANGGTQYAAAGTTGADAQYYKVDLTAGQFVSAALTGAVVDTGMYGDATTYDVLGQATVVATADLDGDGRLDLIIGGTSPFGGDNGLITILKQKPDGTYGVGEQNYDLHDTTDYPITSIAIGDANGDGLPDILVGEAASDPSANVGGTELIKNNGYGNYFYGDQIVKTTADARVTSVAIGDLDGDGQGDLVSGGYGTNADGTTYGYVGVSYSGGGGIGISGGAAIRQVALADVNGDGHLDLVTARGNDEGIEVDFGTGDTGNPFDGSTNFAYGNTYDALAYADVDGDGVKDLVALKDGSDGYDQTTARVVLLDAYGDDQGEYDVNLGAGQINPGASVAVADVNSDGRADLIVAAGQGGSVDGADGNNNPYQLVVALADGNGNVSFNNRRGYQLSDASGIAVADVTGDGRDDLVTVSPDDNQTDHPSAVEILPDTGLYAGGAGTLRVLNSTGQTIATGASGDDVASGVQGFVAPSTGTYYFRVSGSANVDYTLSVTKNAAIGLLPLFFQNRVEDVTGASDALGYLTAGSAGDVLSYYSFTATAGDTIVLHLTKPTPPGEDGANDLTAHLQFNDVDNGPGLLFGSDVAYTVPAGKGGTYTVYVVGDAGAGLYDLTIGGAHGAPPAESVNGYGLSTTTPNYSFPKPLAIYAQLPIDETSVDLSKITVGGYAATSFFVRNQTELDVTFPAAANVGDGSYTVGVAAGAFKSLGGIATTASSQAFTVDTGPKVTSASVANGDTLEPGAHTFNFTFSKSLLSYEIFGSGGFGTYEQILDPTDFQLYNQTTGVTYTATSYQLGPNDAYDTPQENTTLAMTFGNLPEGKYELRLSSGQFAFADKNDVPLDGDNTGTLPSGDGYPYGDYVVDFNVDRAAAAPLGRPTLIAPGGAGAYAFAPAVGAIDPDSDSDDYSFGGQAGDQFSGTVAVTSGILEPSVQLLAPDGSVLATASASYGGTAAFRNVKLASTGTYKLRVTSTGYTGGYTVTAYLNAALQSAVAGGDANNTQAAAQPLDFGDANGPLDRAAVVGANDGVTPDFYNVTLAAGQRLSAALHQTYASTTPTPTTADAALEVLDSTGKVVAIGTVGATPADVTLNDFVPASAGTYTIRVLGITATTTTPYALAVLRNATFEIEPNDAAGTSQDLSRTRRVAGTLASGGDLDSYTFNGAAGDALTIQTATPDDVAAVGANGLQTILRLYAPDGTLLQSTQGNAADANDARILYTVPANAVGAYRVTVTAVGTTSGAYALTIAGSTGAATATSPSVVTATPATNAVAAVAGNRLASAPTTITLVFGEAIDPTSVSASDLQLSVGSVTGVTLVDGRTIQFNVSVPDVDSTVNYSLAAGTVTSLQGQGNAAYASSVVIDKYGPRVVSVSPATNALAPFNKITFTFNEPLAPLPTSYYYQQFFTAFTSPTGQNLLSAGYISNIAISGNTFTVSFYDQTAPGNYTITLAPGLTDLVGNKQDQDGDGINGEPTQDAYTATIAVGSPDLVVSSIQPAAGATYGTPTNVTWTVTNTGDATAAGTWVDKVYLSSDGTYDGNDTLLGTFGAPNTLAAGASYTVTKPLTFPLTDTAAAGTMYVIVVTNAGGTEVESNATNNTTAAADTVALPALVDLAVTNVTAPANLVAGQSYVINWTLSNVGNKDFTGTMQEGLAFSGSATGTNATGLGSVNFTGTLAAGASISQTATITIPAGTSGPVYFVVEENPFKFFFEHGSYANDVGISATPSNAALSPAPDLIATNVGTYAATAYSGNSVTVTWTDMNQGTSAFNGSFNEDVYLGAAADGSNAQYFTSVRFSGPIPIGGSVQRTATFTLPASFPAGNYHPIVVVDSSGEVYENPAGEQNNTTVDPLTITVLVPALPDLAVTNVKGPASALSGQSIPISWTDKNLGPAAVNGSWQDNVYLATDAAGTNLTYFGTFTVSATLAAGGSVNVAQNIQLDPQFTGTYYVVVQTDAGGQVFEANENNNQSVAAAPFTVALAPYPNLIVTSVQGPPSAFSGQSAQLSYFVKNTGTGPTSAPQWYDRVYLSTNPTYDSTDAYLGDFLNPGYLDAGQSYKNTVNVTTPRGFAGTYYFIVMTDSSNQVNEFGPGGETDNYGTGGATQVTLTPAPDLRVTSVTAPTRAFSGQQQTVTWNVRNFGPGNTAVNETQWSDRVFLSSDNVLDNNDVSLGTFTHNGGLNVDGGYTAQGNVTLPTGISGTFYYIVQTDIYNQVFENSFENNNVTPQATPTQITLTPPPDLTVTSATAPAAVTSGHTISVDYTVANTGASQTPNDGWVDSLYLSKTPTLDASAILINQRGHSGALASGSTYSGTLAGQVPYTLASGTYYAIVVTDDGNQVFEYSETNNALAAAATAVTYAPPDLVVSTVASPTTAAAGGGFLVSFTVKNQGAGDTAVTGWRDAVYLSTDSVLGDGDDVLLDYFDHAGLLAPGASYVDNNKGIVIPTSVASGNYYLIVKTDDGNGVFEGDGATSPGELNNASTPQPITITQTVADLQVFGVSGIPNATQGGTASISYTVSNTGSATTNANYWFDNVYLSTTPSLQTGGGANYVLVTQVQHSNALAAGGSYLGNATFTIPSTLAIGTYYVVVVTDATNRVEELPAASEQNNTTAGPAFALTTGAEPDLSVGAIATPATATAGQALNVTYTVNNVGNAAAVASYGGYSGWYDTVYLSLDQNLDTRTDVALGSVVHYGGLTANGSYTNTASLTLPNGLAGIYYVFVVADSSGRVTNDFSPANNTAQAASPVAVTLPPPTDIAIGTVTLPAPPTGGIGLDIGITYTVTNNSDVTARGSWQDALYLSKDGTYDANDALLGTLTHTGDVAAGGSYTATLTAPVPGVNPGDYYVIVRTDIRGALVETTRANNVSASMGAVSLSVPTLTPGVPVTNRITSGRGVYYKVDVPYGQTLIVTASGGNDNQLYLRYGQVPTRGVFDKAYSTPLSGSQSVTIPLTKAGTYYILDYVSPVLGILPDATVGPVPVNVTLKASLPQFSVIDTTYGKGGTAGRLTLQVNGAKFDRTTTATLTSNGVAVAGAVAYYYTDQGRFYATFDLTKVPVGTYDVTVANAAGQRVVVTNGLTVVAGGGGHLIKYINSPGAVRAGSPFAFQVDWANDGLDDVDAPLLVVLASGGVGTDPRYINSAGYTFIGTAPDDGPAGILRASQTGTATFFSVNGPDTIRLGNVGTDPTTPFDFDYYRDELILPGENDATFDAAFDRMKQDIGATFGDVGAAFARDATLIPEAIGPANYIESLFQLDLERAKAELTTSISGRAVAPDIAVQIADRTVWATNATTGQIFATTSLNDGSFVFANLTAGTYAISFDGAFVTSGGAGLAVAANQHLTNVTIGLTAGQAFDGTVRDGATTVGVAGARVSVVAPDGTVTIAVADSDGDYDFAGLPDGPYALFADADGYARSIQAFTPGPGVNPNDFSLAPQATISGTLALPASSSGTVIVTAQLVGVAGAAGGFDGTVVGNTFSLKGLPAGTYLVDVIQHDSVTRQLTIEVGAGEAAQAGTVTLDGTAEVTGTVTSADASLPPGGLSLQVIATSGAAVDDGTAVDGTGVVATVVTVGNDGSFVVDQLPAGNYLLRLVTSAGYAADVPVTIVAGQTLTGVNVVLRQGDTLQGTVTAASAGVVLSNVRVTLVGADGTTATTTADASGHYAFAHVRPGAYTASVPGSVVSVTLPTAEGSTVTANLTATLAGTITGRLTVGGASASFGAVSVYSAGQLLTTANAAADGTFAIYLTTAGTYDLVATATGGTFLPGSVTIGGGGNVQVTANFAAGTGSLAIDVADSLHDVTKDQVAVSLITALGVIEVAQFTPAADGTVSLGHLAAGQYRVSVLTVDGREAVTTVTVSSAATTTAALTVAVQSRITGFVSDAGTGPLSGALVVVYAAGTGTVLGVALTGADGRYSIAGLAPGGYDLVVLYKGHQAVVDAGVSLASAPVTLDVVSPLATATLAGRVVDVSGHPVAGASVTVVDAAGHTIGIGASGADGTYLIAGASGASLAITARADGGKTIRATVNATASGTTTVADLKLPAALALGSGVVAATTTTTTTTGGSTLAVTAPAGGSSAAVLTATNATAGAAAVTPFSVIDTIKSFISGGVQLGNTLLNLVGFGYDEDPNAAHASDLDPLDECGTCQAKLDAANRAIRIQQNAYSNAKEIHDSLLGRILEADALLAYDLLETAGVLAGLVILVDGIITALAAAGVASAAGGVFGTSVGVVGATGYGYTATYAAVSFLGQINNVVAAISDAATAPNARAAEDDGKKGIDAVTAMLAGYFSLLSACTEAAIGAIGNNGSNLLGLIQLFRDSQGVFDRLRLKDFTDAIGNLADQIDTFAPADSNYHRSVPQAKVAVQDYNRCVARASRTTCHGDTHPTMTAPTDYTTIIVALPPSKDPNDISGPAGFGPAGYTNASRPLGYTIDFENDADAAAPAQVIQVTQQLDSDLDYRTFRLGTIVLAGHAITPPANSAFFQTRLDLTADLGVYVDVFAGIDVSTGQAFWDFTAIDPATGERPIDPRVGLLPPDVVAPEGEGFVTYTIRPLATAQTGTVIAAAATVIFDENAPIDTPSISNTLDLAAPTSSVAPLPANSPVSGGVAVQWSGADDANGSGIRSYTIYVATDGGDYVAWLTDTTATSAVYNGTPGHSYAFYSVATDNSGNVEAAPTTPDATTSVAGTKATLTNLSTSVTETYGTPTTTFAGTVTGSPAAGETVAVTLNGKTVNAPIDASGHFAATFDTSGLNASTTPYAVTYSYLGDDYLGGGSDATTTTLTIAKATLLASVADATKTYGTADPTFTIGYSGFVNGQSTLNLNGTLALTTTEPAVANAPVGTYAITASGLSSDNYAITYVGGTLSVTRASLVITAASEYTTYGQPMPTPIATYSGLAAGESAANLSMPPTLSTTATSTSAPGTYGITIGGAVDANYDITYVTGNVVIAQATPTVTLGTPPASIVYDGTTGVDAWATATIGKPDGTVSGAAAPTGDVTLKYYRGTVVTAAAVVDPPVNAGVYTVVAFYAGDANYAATASAPITFTIGKATPTLTLPTPPSNLTYDGTTSVDAWAKPTLSGPATAPAPTGPVTLAYYSGPTAMGTALASPPINAGTYTVVATYNGNSNYAAVTSAPQTFTINPPQSTALSTTFKVNDGSVQRSMVKSLTVTFNAGVTLASGAITLVDSGGNAVAFTLTASTDGTTYVLTFPAGTGGSLTNGRYTLVVHANKVSGRTLSADQTYNVFRLFGDSDGNGTVNNVDAAAFKKAYNSALGSAKYVDYFDYNGDGKIDSADNAFFAADQGVTI